MTLLTSFGLGYVAALVVVLVLGLASRRGGVN